MIDRDSETFMENLEILCNPTAMKAIHAAKDSNNTYHPLDLDDENFGLSDTEIK
jgi:hypothetical protein